MRSIPELAKNAACALIGAAALGLASAASAQTAAPETNAPAASQDAANAGAAESPRRGRERRHAQETAAAPPADNASPPRTAAKTDGSELVCKNVKPAGSRLPERVCYTQAEWDSLTEASQDDMRRVRDRSRASGARPQ